jgi:hypothetical protein
MRRLDRQTRPEAGKPDPEDPVPSGEPGSGDRALQDGKLMAQRQVLEGDGRRPEEQGTEEGPESGRKEHRHPRGSDVACPRVYAFTKCRCLLNLA